MKVNYDHMFQGLIVEIDEDAFLQMTRDLCTDSDQTEWLEKTIHQIIYQGPTKEDSKGNERTILLTALYGLLPVFSFVLMGLGGYKLYEIVRDLVL